MAKTPVAGARLVATHETRAMNCYNTSVWFQPGDCLGTFTGEQARAWWDSNKTVLLIEHPNEGRIAILSDYARAADELLHTQDVSINEEG